MTENEKEIMDLKKEVAVLREKISRLEVIVYSVISFVALQLLGLFIFWAKDIISKP